MLQKGDSFEIRSNAQNPVQNPLFFDKIPFDYDEWDNIPPIVTK
jgi:hypothetical protein